jgi:hypothetical protein
MTRNSAEVGGGFFVDRFNTQVVLENSVVSLNRAVENGGGAALYAISMTLRNVSLLGNAVSKCVGGCICSTSRKALSSAATFRSTRLPPAGRDCVCTSLLGW